MLTEQIKEIIADVRLGIPIIIVDDKDREDEGDVVIAGAAISQETLAFMIRTARGLMCIPCAGYILDRLDLPMMVSNSTDRNGTPFTVSVDANCEGMTTGMPVSERMKTIEVFTNPKAVPGDLARPGHLFPLRAQEGLLEARRGHTEASVQLMLLAGLEPVAVIAEIINDDGTMARGESLHNYAKKHQLKTITVAEIVDATK